MHLHVHIHINTYTHTYFLDLLMSIYIYASEYWALTYVVCFDHVVDDAGILVVVMMILAKAMLLPMVGYGCYCLLW